MLDEPSPAGGVEDGEREPIGREHAVTLHRASLDLTHLQREPATKSAEVIEPFAPIDRAQRIGHEAIEARSAGDELHHALGRAVRKHLSPATVTTLEERAPTRHRHVPLMHLAALPGWVPGIVAWQIREEAAQDIAVIVAAQVEAEQGAVGRRRHEVEAAIQPRIGRRSHVDVLEQVSRRSPVGWSPPIQLLK